MKLKLYAIKDTLTTYLGIFPCMNEAVAARNMEALANDVNTVVGQNPKDHQLYYLGEWDNMTGKIKAEDEPVFVANAISFVKAAYKPEEEK